MKWLSNVLIFLLGRYYWKIPQRLRRRLGMHCGEDFSDINELLMKLQNQRHKVLPQDGGCWYCYTTEFPLRYSLKFNTHVHVKCVERALHCSADHVAQIMAREFGVIR